MWCIPGSMLVHMTTVNTRARNSVVTACCVQLANVNLEQCL